MRISLNSHSPLKENHIDKEQGKSNKKETGSSVKDKIEISNTSKAFNKLNDFLNLGKKRSFDLSDLNPKEKDEFLKMLSELLKAGVVGYEILEVNGKPEKHYIVNEIGDSRIKGAKLYNERRYGNAGM